jgi:hypothetical protein
MEVSTQFHASAVLPPEPIGYEAGCVQVWSGSGRKDKKSYIWWESNLGRPTRDQ